MCPVTKLHEIKQIDVPQRYLSADSKLASQSLILVLKCVRKTCPSHLKTLIKSKVLHESLMHLKIVYKGRQAEMS